MAEETHLGNEKKEEGLRALNYERDMLRATAMALASGIIENSLALNALLESFLIHARLLIEFLYGPHKRDDLRPGDWLDPDAWGRTCGEESRLLKGTYEDANKYLAHLTATRLNQEKKTWDYPAILREIETLLDRFFQQMQPVSGEGEETRGTSGTGN